MASSGTVTDILFFVQFKIKDTNPGYDNSF